MKLGMVAVADELAIEMKAAGSEDRAVNEKRYLKSEIQHYGVNVPTIRKSARRFARERRSLTKTDLIGLTTELWDRDVYELRKLAVNILAARIEIFCVNDVGFVEGLLRRSHTWALIDDLAINVVAPMILCASEAERVRARWSEDDDFWVRRTAMLALLPGLRRGVEGWEEFARYADAMFDEEEFFIRKAIGWVLREVSKHSPDLVFEWMKPRAAMASSVTFREAVKYLSEDQRSRLTELRKASARRTRS
ncbi:MAG: DNA alkylation repair protein [Chloroflexi bacterium]|nr:DNA alkylation repair protein [Chloroflexota bacterium]